MNHIYKWALFNSATIWIIFYLQYFHDAFNNLIFLDHTYVSFLILVIYTVISVYLGIMGRKSNFEAVRFHANNLPLIGMAGTLIAVMMVLHQAQSSGATSLAEFEGLYSIFITTLFGVLFMGLTKYQVAMVFKDYTDV